MKNTFKKFFIVLFSAIILLTGTAPISNAASKHMIIVNTKKNTLNYYVNYTLVKEFRCATGKASTPTPQCKTTIVNKIVDRPYYKGNIPGGDPRNPLGRRWMGLNINGTYGSTYGIHGNNNESSIGKNVSGGCIRMHNSEVEWLFDQVTIGTVVLIKNTPNSDDYIASCYNITILKNGWFTKNGYTYYRKSNGYLAKGWTTISDKTYYFGRTTGKLYTGWATINGNKYYLGSDGVRRTGWTTIGSNKYYFGRTSGKLYTGWTSIGGKMYYLGRTSGKLYTGWTTVGGKTYYLGTDGAKRTGWVTVDGNKYYLGSDGVKRTGWRTIGGNRYYFGKTTGKLYTGWTSIGGKMYYLGTEGIRVTGIQTIDGVVYEFDQNGVLIRTISEDKDDEQEPTTPNDPVIPENPTMPENPTEPENPTTDNENSSVENNSTNEEAVDSQN